MHGTACMCREVDMAMKEPQGIKFGRNEKVNRDLDILFLFLFLFSSF